GELASASAVNEWRDGFAGGSVLAGARTSVAATFVAAAFVAAMFVAAMFRVATAALGRPAFRSHLAVVLRCAFQRFHLQGDAVDRGHAYLLARRDGGRPVRAGSPLGS